jgi:hypothetical protein
LHISQPRLFFFSTSAVWPCLWLIVRYLWFMFHYVMVIARMIWHIMVCFNTSY